MFIPNCIMLCAYQPWHCYEIVDVNLKGVLFTAQAAGRQMARFDNGGSIIMVASICGSVAVDVRRS